MSATIRVTAVEGNSAWTPFEARALFDRIWAAFPGVAVLADDELAFLDSWLASGQQFYINGKLRSEGNWRKLLQTAADYNRNRPKAPAVPAGEGVRAVETVAKVRPGAKAAYDLYKRLCETLKLREGELTDGDAYDRLESQYQRTGHSFPWPSKDAWLKALNDARIGGYGKPKYSRRNGREGRSVVPASKL